MSAFHLHEAAVQHYTRYLISEGYLKENLRISKADLRRVFSHEYQPKYCVNVDYDDMLKHLHIFKCVKSNAKANDDTIVFNESTVKQITQKGQDKHEQLRIETILSKPIRKVIVSDHVLKATRQRNVGVSESDCQLCGVTFDNVSEYEAHMKLYTHWLRHTLRNDRKQLDPSKYNIEIMVNKMKQISTEVIIRPGLYQNVLVEILKTDKVSSVLFDVFPLSTLKQIQLQKPQLPVNLNAGQLISFTMSIQFEDFGAYMYHLFFKIKNPKLGFVTVLKEIIFRVQSDVMDALSPTSKFDKSASKVLNIKQLPLIAGNPLPRKRPDLHQKLSLKEYKIPPPLQELINRGFKITEKCSKSVKEKAAEIANLLGVTSTESNWKGPTVNTYADYFKLLLHIEEHQMNKNIHMYDCSNQTMKIVNGSKNLLELQVPGLVEKCPSLLQGDSVCVKIQGDQENIAYEGIIHFIQQCAIWLSFHKSFLKKFQPDMKFEVSFNFSRYPLRCQHQALDLLKQHKAEALLFPYQCQGTKTVPKLKLFNKDLETNAEQLQAVKHIVSGTSYPAPYIVFGPPGTGKTVTLVEAIMQIYHLKPKSHILVCTPSNSSANLITVHLLKVIPKSAVMRLYSQCCAWQSVPKEIHDSCNYNIEERQYFYPPKEVIMKYRILIVTLITASRLASVKIPPRHFSYLFIDECGQASETEAIVPIAGLCTRSKKRGIIKGKIILAGDPKQLGPVITSAVASQFGLGTSILERLMNTCELYAKNDKHKEYNPAVVTKLLQSYRSHSNILEIPNRLFYNYELKPSQSDTVYLACNWDHLPRKGFPVIFHSVMGMEERQGTSPSYFNRQEIDVVINYVNNLLSDTSCGHKVKEEDIGIITPYSCQVKKMKKALARIKFTKILVGSVENFQSLERLVIIISTVRSTQCLLEDDYKYSLGFLKNYKRFNVALTRAKALLIVVGNPQILQYDKCWKEFIHYSQSNGGYRGTPFQPKLNTEAKEEEVRLQFFGLCVTPSGKR